jgi:hypothetical protein
MKILEPLFFNSNDGYSRPVMAKRNTKSLSEKDCGCGSSGNGCQCGDNNNLPFILNSNDSNFIVSSGISTPSIGGGGSLDFAVCGCQRNCGFLQAMRATLCNEIAEEALFSGGPEAAAVAYFVCWSASQILYQNCLSSCPPSNCSTGGAGGSW